VVIAGGCCAGQCSKAGCIRGRCQAAEPQAAAWWQAPNAKPYNQRTIQPTGEAAAAVAALAGRRTEARHLAQPGFWDVSHQVNSPRRRSRGCGSCTGWARRRSAPSGRPSGRTRRSAPCPARPPCGSCPRPLCARCPSPCPTCCRQTGQQVMRVLKSPELPQH
jgi:hypothetical protein